MPRNANTAPPDTPVAESDAGFLATAAEVEAALATLRNQLRATLDRILPGESSARSLGRFLQASRMTAWRCWTIAHVADPAQALRAMPGPRGWADLLKRLARRGATDAEISTLRQHVDRYEMLVRTRRLGQAEIDALAAGVGGSKGERARIVASRRNASRGAAALYGVHARLLVIAYLVAPGKRKGTIDLASVAIIEGLGRLRPGPPWPVIQHAVASDRQQRLRHHRPLGDGASMPGVIRSLSSPGIVGSELTEHTDASGVTTIRFGDLRPEHRKGIRIVAANSVLGAQLGDGKVKPVCLHSNFLQPADLAVIELLVHRSLPRHTDPVAALLGTPIVPQSLPQADLASRLPLEEVFRPCEAGVASPRARAVSGAYADALSRACTSLRNEVDSFDAFRIELPYPPAFAVASASVELRSGRAPHANRTRTR